MPRARRWPWPRATWWEPSPARPRPLTRSPAVCVRGPCWPCRWWWPAACTRQRSVIGEVRELSFALEPWTLREQGFETALQAIADRFEADHRVVVTLDVADADALSGDDQVCLFQIVREAMTNALKHANP